MFVLALGAVAAWLYWRPASRAPRRLLVALFLGYWILSTPVGAGALIAGLSYGLTPVSSLDLAKGGNAADAIVLLGGGAMTLTAGGVTLGQLTQTSALRALEAARVYRLMGKTLVIASGGIPYPEIQLKPESEMLRDALVQAGVAPADIVQESASRTTRDQARMIRPLLPLRGARRFVLVTSPPHMRRALAAFQAEGLDPVPSVSRMRSEHLASPPFFLPNDESLYFSDLAIYSYAAWVYYWWNGWTAAPRA
jgi:uncharacterized SAM-binding protein YcdF (DUF218 family)